MNRSLFRLPNLSLPLALLALVACTGGAPTTPNADTTTAAASVYAGPAPISADV